MAQTVQFKQHADGTKTFYLFCQDCRRGITALTPKKQYCDECRMTRWKQNAGETQQAKRSREKNV